MGKLLLLRNKDGEVTMGTLKRYFIRVGYTLQTVVLGLALAGTTGIVRPTTTSAETTTIVANEDAFVVTSGASSSTNFGSSNPLNISNSTNRAFVKFPLSSLPSSATVSSITLVVNQTQTGITSGALNVHNSPSTWNENTLTGLNMPSYTTAALASSPTATASTPLPVGDITFTLPGSTVSPGAPDVSFAFDYSVSGIVAKIASRESGTTTGPRLILNYSLPSSVSQTVNSKEDAYVVSTLPSNNYGAASPLNVSSATNRGLLKFSTAFLPAGTSVVSVKLRLYHKATLTTGGVRVHPYGTTWSEGTINYATTAWDTTILATSSTLPTAETWEEITLPLNAVTVGASDVSFGLDYSVSGVVAKIASHEDAASAPQLVVSYTPVQGSATLPVTEDTFMASSNTATNYGNATSLFASNSTNRTLLKFNAAQVPVGATINGVSLVVNQTVSGLTSGGIRVHPALSSWAENTVTWATQPTWDTTILSTSGVPTVGSMNLTLPTSSVYGGAVVSFGLDYSVSGVVAKTSSKEAAGNVGAYLVVNYTVNSATPPPTATTTAATDVGENAATLTASINPNNVASSYYFEYYHNDTPGLPQPQVVRTNSSQIAASLTAQQVSLPTTYRFAPNTAYSYRVVAYNANGTTYGNYMTFTTAAATDHVIATAGDMSCDPSSASYYGGLGAGTNCRQMATSDAIIADTTIEKVIPLGDNQYECGSPAGYAQAYDASWGRFKNKTMPVAGNHEYATGSQVTSTYCRGALTAGYTGGGTQISVDRGPGQTFPASGTFAIRLIKATCIQTTTDNTTCYDNFTATVTSDPNVWDVVRTADTGTQTPVLDFAQGDYVVFMDGRAAYGYFGYFGDIASPNQPGCTDHCAGYYSWNIGNWHMVALNSNCSAADKYNSNASVGCTVGTAQYNWLVADLNTVKPGQGILAYIHHPRLSSGEHGDHDGISNTTDLSDIWNLLRSYNGDIMLAGHDHNYERFKQMGYSVNRVIAPEPTTGMRMWVIGNGGKNLISTPANPIHDADREVFNNTGLGVLKLTLGTSSYSWQYVNAAGIGFPDVGTTPLHTN